MVFVLLFGNPHGIKGGKTCENAPSNPGGELPFCGKMDLELNAVSR